MNVGTDVLQVGHKSLAATIELSLSSLTFQALNPNARDLLGVIAFFPRGVHENNIDWLFPTIDGRKKIFDKFHALSLTHENNGFITILAPIRDHLSPKDPISAPLLHLTKERYFSRLSAGVKPGSPGSKGAKWITSEDVNIEHLLDVYHPGAKNRGTRRRPSLQTEMLDPALAAVPESWKSHGMRSASYQNLEALERGGR